MKKKITKAELLAIAAKKAVHDATVKGGYCGQNKAEVRKSLFEPDSPIPADRWEYFIEGWVRDIIRGNGFKCGKNLYEEVYSVYATTLNSVIDAIEAE